MRDYREKRPTKGRGQKKGQGGGSMSKTTESNGNIM